MEKTTSHKFRKFETESKLQTMSHKFNFLENKFENKYK